MLTFSCPPEEEDSTLKLMNAVNNNTAKHQTFQPKVILNFMYIFTFYQPNIIGINLYDNAFVFPPWAGKRPSENLFSDDLEL